MDIKNLTDQEVKKIFSEKWPQKTSLWNDSGEKGKNWLIGQPTYGGPRLASPGSALFNTQPDGLWVRLFDKSELYCDVIVIESCRTFQNLSDKRARYMSSHAALLLRCPKKWLSALNIKVPEALTNSVAYPVRHLRVLYTLPNEKYDVWRNNNVPGSHEFMCSHSSLNSFTAQRMQTFLKRLSPYSQFYSG